MSKINCHVCKQDKNKILTDNFFIQNPICKVCYLCVKCTKDKIKKDDVICAKCCSMCKMCKKIFVKNDWPNITLKRGICDLCLSLCKKCERHIPDGKEIIYKKNKYCEKCMNSFNPAERIKKYKQNKYILITDKKNNVRHFKEWKLDECKKNDIKRNENIVDNFIKANPDPSNKRLRYRLINIKQNTSITHRVLVF